MSGDPQDVPADEASAAGEAEVAADAELAADAEETAHPPVYVFDVRRRKKKARRSKRWRDVEALEQGLTQGTRTTLRGAGKALKTWDRLRDRSAKQRKDGGLKEAPGNALDAWEAGIGIMIEAPRDARDAVRKVLGRKKLGGLFTV